VDGVRWIGHQGGDRDENAEFFLVPGTDDVLICTFEHRPAVGERSDGVDRSTYTELRVVPAVTSQNGFASARRMRSP